MFNKLNLIQKRYNDINTLMGQPDILSDLKQLQELGKEKSELENIVDIYTKYKANSTQLDDMTNLLKETDEPEMAILVKHEIDQFQQRMDELLDKLKLTLLPRDPNANKDVIVEIRAGTGGEEAGLFVADMFRMYGRYAQSKKWKVSLISTSSSGTGGFREVVFEVKGKGTFSQLKHERGVHRVQRVPETEGSGRIHTSTVTVAVLPTVEEIELKISQDDIRMDLFHAGGAGGQNVNKVTTAVRITHLPTGLVVVCQDERSQLKNKTKAMAVLRARIFDQEQRKQSAEIDKQRKIQVGTGERAEKIRTYNFPQDRVTDHRLNSTFHNLPQIMDGDIEDIIKALIAQEQTSQLGAVLS